MTAAVLGADHHLGGTPSDIDEHRMTLSEVNTGNHPEIDEPCLLPA